MSTTALTTGGLNPLLKTYYDRRFLEMAKPVMVAHQFADKSRDIPKHEGQTVSFQRYSPLAVIDSTVSEGANPDFVDLVAINVEATLEKYANASKLTEEVQTVLIDDTLRAAVDLHGENMGESINRRYRKEMSLGFYPMRVDNSTDYAASGTVTQSTPTVTGSTTTSLGSFATHLFVGGVIVFTSGRCAGQSARVASFTTSTGAITWTPAFKRAPKQNDAFRVVATQGIDSTKQITTSAVERAVALLKHYKAPKYDGKNYIGIISPFVTYDFMQDSAWVNADQYAGSTKLYSGEIGRWGGVRWVEDTEPWTESVCDGSSTQATNGMGYYVAAGAVNHTPIFGRHSYAGVKLEKVPDKVIVKIPGPQDTSNPINAFGTVGWRIYFVPKALNSVWGVSLISGATTVA